MEGYDDPPSGVIDLREMGGVYTDDADDADGSQPAAPRGPDTIMAVAMPAAAEPRRSASDWGAPAFMVGSFLLAVAMLMLLISKRSDDGDPVVTEIPVPAPVAAAQPPAPAAPPAAPAVAVAAAPAPAVIQAAPERPAAAPPVRTPVERAPVEREPLPAKPAALTSAKAPTVAAPEPDAPAPDEAAAPAGDDFETNIALSVADGSFGAPTPPAAPIAAAPVVPAVPSREVARDALESVAREVKLCGRGVDDLPELARVKLVVSGQNGRVSEARVQNLTGPAAACITRAVRAARFGTFTRDSFTVVYPYRM